MTKFNCLKITYNWVCFGSNPNAKHTAKTNEMLLNFNQSKNNTFFLQNMFSNFLSNTINLNVEKNKKVLHSYSRNPVFIQINTS